MLAREANWGGLGISDTAQLANLWRIELCRIKVRHRNNSTFLYCDASSWAEDTQARSTHISHLCTILIQIASRRST